MLLWKGVGCDSKELELAKKQAVNYKNEKARSWQNNKYKMENDEEFRKQQLEKNRKTKGLTPITFLSITQSPFDHLPNAIP
jgi:hypothetical protein